MPKMHPSLQILDIVETIISHLDRLNDQKDLAALARTCVAFRDSALALLWKEQGLMNLLRCFPTDLWNETDSSRPVSNGTAWTMISADGAVVATPPSHHRSRLGQTSHLCSAYPEAEYARRELAL
jgi:hypothetical protein